MDSSLSVQIKDFPGDGEEFTKVSRAVTQAKITYIDNSVEFGKSCDYHGIIELQHLIDPREMALLKEPYEE